MGFGGAATSYNYDALSYSSNSVVQPAEKSYLYVNTTESLATTNPSLSLPMDIRGCGDLNPTSKILAGGMYADREVSNKVIKCTWGYSLRSPNMQQAKFKVFPNPTNNAFYIDGVIFDYVILYDQQGRQIIKTSSKTIDIAMLNKGQYTLQLHCSDKVMYRNIIKL